MKRRNWILVLSAASAVTLGVVFVRAATARAESLEEQQANLMVSHINLYRNMLGLIQDFRAIAEDASASGVTAVLSVEDHLPRKADQVAFMERMLPNAKDEVIRRAIRIKLAELYKDTDAPAEKGIAQLEALITGGS
ncbi:MAG: hypothetical protein CMJ18_27225 [Phycisphaeraceae bacterium]|nr:hypothetical protein [Phycisphaeraceae bacterium]